MVFNILSKNKNKNIFNMFKFKISNVFSNKISSVLQITINLNSKEKLVGIFLKKIRFLKKKYILCSYKFKIHSLRQDKTHISKKLRI